MMEKSGNTGKIADQIRARYKIATGMNIQVNDSLHVTEMFTDNRGVLRLPSGAVGLDPHSICILDKLEKIVIPEGYVECCNYPFLGRAGRLNVRDTSGRLEILNKSKSYNFLITLMNVIYPSMGTKVGNLEIVFNDKSSKVSTIASIFLSGIANKSNLGKLFDVLLRSADLLNSMTCEELRELHKICNSVAFFDGDLLSHIELSEPLCSWKSEYGDNWISRSTVSAEMVGDYLEIPQTTQIYIELLRRLSGKHFMPIYLSASVREELKLMHEDSKEILKEVEHKGIELAKEKGCYDEEINYVSIPRRFL